MKNLKRNVDGITLIALVVTIIVLLILAGVTIAMLTGENGILGRAGQASETTKDVSEDEQVKLAVADALVDGTGTLSKDNLETALESEFGTLADGQLEGDGPWTFKGERKTYTIETTGKVTSEDSATPPTEKPGKPDKDGLFTVSSTIDGKNEPENIPEAASKNPIIPAGFKPLETETAKWKEGVSAPQSDNGLVIEDIDHNQFVWVPVPDFDNFKRVAGYFGGSLHSSVFANCGEANAEGINDKTEETAETKAEAIVMYASVKKYGGFYIGRYEAGAEGGKLDGTNWAEKPTLVCKQGATVYNYINWNEAIGKSREMKNGKKWETTAISTLIYGVQWDATMQFFDNAYLDGSCNTTSSYVANSTGRGNYKEDANINTWKGSITTTGALPAYAEKNIYDMAGNASEWTMENNSRQIQNTQRRRLQQF